MTTDGECFVLETTNDGESVVHNDTVLSQDSLSQLFFGETYGLMCISHPHHRYLKEDFKIDAHTLFKKELPKPAIQFAHNGDSRNE